MGYLSFPNAKINIGLQVTEKLSSGYHHIQSVFYPTHITDAIELIPASSQTRVQTRGINIPDSNSKDNLCYKAWELLNKDHKIDFYDIYLYKNIPIGAGLGGGSSDAVSVLKIVNELNDLGLGKTELKKYANALGSDCAFFLDNKPSFVTGTGTDLSEINLNLSGCYLVLVCSDIFISTKEAYSNIVPKPAQYNLEQSIQLPIEEWKNTIHNDFEDGLFNIYPKLKNIKAQLYELGGVYVSMSGSGSSMYGIFKEKPSESLKTEFGDAKVFISEL